MGMILEIRGYSGFDFTSCNRRENQHLVEVRLDRFMCSNSWENYFNNSQVSNIAIMVPITALFRLI